MTEAQIALELSNGNIVYSDLNENIEQVTNEFDILFVEESPIKCIMVDSTIRFYKSEHIVGMWIRTLY